MSTKSTIHQVNNDKKVSEYSQLCSNCGLTTHELMNQTKLCKATISFTCSVCFFKCCSKNNLGYHMQKDHKIPINYDITSDSQEIKMSKSMNNSSNEQSPHRFLRSKIINFDYIILFFFTYLIYVSLFS